MIVCPHRRCLLAPLPSIALFTSQIANYIDPIRQASTLPLSYPTSFFLSLLIKPLYTCYVAIQRAKATEAIVGCISGRHSTDELEITTLCVSPSHRRSGVASSLLSNMLKSKAKPRTVLHVQPTNRPAKAFYERWSFREEALERGHYSHALKRRAADRDALRMVRESERV
jgi:ribosomal protein S18 acetylase RimI-like enzyme